MPFHLAVDYRPRGDQATAIEQLLRGIHDGEKHQVLLGVTGSGKTFTMAKVIEKLGRPALVLAHNKTLAAQLYHEFRTFFPSNAVEYFVSYYDYYQPEAYIPSGDVYIEKESTVNDELDKLRLAATKSLFERRDCVIVASVSCIYGLGSPDAYYGMLLMLEKGQKITRKEILSKLVEILYDRNDGDFRRGTFRVRGDVIEVYPTYDDNAYRIEMWGDEIESLSQVDPLLGQVKQTYLRLPIYPKTHYVMTPQSKEQALKSIEAELDLWQPELEKQGKLIEAQRVYQRTMFDLEMIRQIGYCHGIENYSRHFSGRLPGEAPPTLLDYLPQDHLIFIDESHQTMPQIHGMSQGDRSRKDILVNFGFRLPSARDNRPLTFEEFENRVNQVIYVSATPGPYELTKAAGEVVEQIIRPTGLVDPEVEIRPIKGQVDDLLHQIRLRVERNERVLVTTLTKRMSEDLAEYYAEVGVKCAYLHSEVSTLDRIKILRDLRRGEYDALIGVNLLREGLDLPEVSLVAILDADKEGFLRSSGSLIQTIGRAARNINGIAILYADVMTESMRRALDETNRRRTVQRQYNVDHGITPESIVKPIDMCLVAIAEADYMTVSVEPEDPVEEMTAEQRAQFIQEMEERMRDAAKKFDFEKAAQLRDRIKALKSPKIMKKPLSVALVCAGSIGDSAVSKIRNLADHLGPVKSSAVRVASRMANILRAGHAVSTYEELKTCRVFLIAVPDVAVAPTIAEMLASEICWTGKIVVLASSRMGCKELALLAEAGAHTGSLALVPGFDDAWFLLEGNRFVLVNVRPLLASRGVRITTLTPFHRIAYESGLACVGARLIPLLIEAAESMKTAGLNKVEADAILERQLIRMGRSYLRSGKRAVGATDED